MIQVGRVCLKIAGRDAGKLCVVVDMLDDTFVLIDGQTRRKKCNVRHLEPTEQIITIKKSASHAEVAAQFKGMNLDVYSKKESKQKTSKPAKIRKVKAKAAKPVKAEAKDKPKQAQISKPKQTNK